MKFEGNDSLPPYLRRTAVPEGTAENIARLRVKKMYDEQRAILQNHIHAGIDPTSEYYKDTLERVNLLGQALNEGSYEHIDVEPTISEKARAERLKLIALERRKVSRDELKVLETEPVKDLQGIAECLEALERIELQLKELDGVLTKIQAQEAGNARHRLRTSQPLPPKKRVPEPPAPPVPQPFKPGGFDGNTFDKNSKRKE